MQAFRTNTQHCAVVPCDSTTFLFSQRQCCECSQHVVSSALQIRHQYLFALYIFVMVNLLQSITDACATFYAATNARDNSYTAAMQLRDNDLINRLP